MMETLTLTLHKAKETKNKVVYGTTDGSVIQSVYIDKDALGDETAGHHPGGHIRPVRDTTPRPDLQARDSGGVGTHLPNSMKTPDSRRDSQPTLLIS